MGNKIHSFSPKEQLSTALMCLFLSLFCTQVSGASPTKEDKVKAAIVFKLTKFVSWPGRTKALTMCIVGSGSINQELQKINYKFSLGRRISITHKQPTARLEKLCDLIYIHNTHVKTIQKITQRLEKKPVLTISDHNGFTNQGGMIELYRVGSRIRFAISQSATRGTKLTIDAQLKKMAKKSK